MKDSNKMVWAGRVLSVITVLVLLMSAAMKFVKPAGFAEGLKGIGWDPEAMTYVGIVELASAVLYAIPKTSVLGAILIAAYLGGATATHARVGEQIVIPVLLGVVAWLGLWLRDKRLREVLPVVG
ncbi:MAG: DoxX family protein [Pyrinomonadaceae bacterium]|nr:DoxX family protein [Pyrinomonadaceae bacterium]